jgi:RNA polymerase sigma factor for flagellar operon FliA
MSKSKNIIKLAEEIMSKAEQDKLVIDSRPMVKAIVNSMAQTLPSHVDRNDLISAGYLGLIDAAKKFDPSMGVLFKTFAEPRIRGAVKDELRATDPASRTLRGNIKDYERVIQRLSHELGRKPDDEEVAAALGMNMDDYHNFVSDIMGGYPEEPTSKEPSHDLFDILGTGVSRDALTKAINSLPPQEKKFVKMYYIDGMKSEEIAQEMGVTPGRASQIHTLTIQALKKKFGVKEEESFNLANKILVLV